MSNIFSIDIGTSKQCMMRSEASIQQSGEYYPTVCHTGKACSLFNNVISLKPNAVQLCDNCSSLINEAYRSNCYYDPSLIFKLIDNSFQSETLALIQKENNLNSIIYKNKQHCALSSALGLQFLFEYFCYLMSINETINKQFSDICLSLRESSCPYHYVYAISDEYSNAEIKVLQTIQEACYLPAATYVHNSIAASLECCYKYLDQEPQTIVIIDVGASSTRMYLVEINNKELRIKKTLNDKSVNSSTILNIFCSACLHLDKNEISKKYAFEISELFKRKCSLLSDEQCEAIDFTIESMNEEEDLDEVITRKQYIESIKSAGVFDILRQDAQQLCENHKVDVLVPIGQVTYIHEITRCVEDELRKTNPHLSVDYSQDSLKCVARGAWTVLYEIKRGNIYIEPSNGIWFDRDTETLNSMNESNEDCIYIYLETPAKGLNDNYDYDSIKQDMMATVDKVNEIEKNQQRIHNQREELKLLFEEVSDCVKNSPNQERRKELEQQLDTIYRGLQKTMLEQYEELKSQLISIQRTVTNQVDVNTNMVNQLNQEGNNNQLNQEGNNNQQQEADVYNQQQQESNNNQFNQEGNNNNYQQQQTGVYNQPNPTGNNNFQLNQEGYYQQQQAGNNNQQQKTDVYDYQQQTGVYNQPNQEGHNNQQQEAGNNNQFTQVSNNNYYQQAGNYQQQKTDVYDYQQQTSVYNQFNQEGYYQQQQAGNNYQFSQAGNNHQQQTSVTNQGTIPIQYNIGNNTTQPYYDIPNQTSHNYSQLNQTNSSYQPNQTSNRHQQQSGSNNPSSKSSHKNSKPDNNCQVL